jgi:SAM-dependent methyltransferase
MAKTYMNGADPVRGPSLNLDIAAIRQRAEPIARTFTWRERVLAAFSRDPTTIFLPADGYDRPTNEWNADNALSLLRREFPDLDTIVRGKRVLDYGCGDGFQSIALAQAGAAVVMGVDIEAHRLEHGRRMAQGLTNVTFGVEPKGVFDLAISLNSFEHFPMPERNLAELAAAICQGGKIFIAFGPLWLSPYGAHMYFFTPIPWVHLLFFERTVFKVRQLYREDGAETYSPGLNKMTVRRFERIIAASGLRTEHRIYHTVKRLPAVAKVPWLRELVINQVTCILAK